jgi:triosephosphate isomerase
MKYIIGNWKSHKNIDELHQWLLIFNQKLSQDERVRQMMESEKVKVILAPPFHLLAPALQLLQNSKVHLAVQDISEYGEGSYTGAIAANNIYDLAKFAIIGHSERRKFFGETETNIKGKLQQCKEFWIEPIHCVRDERDQMYQEFAHIIAFEPVASIGSGNNAPIEEVVNMRENLGITDQIFLYGGSVTRTNAATYLNHEKVDGLLIGGASLYPEEFYDIIRLVQ